MKKQYVTIGTKTISSNVFRNILRPLNNYSFKPTGGLWASTFNKYMISDWYEYMMYEGSYLQAIKNIKEAAIFSLKDNAKILTIDSCEQINELSKKYPSYHHILGLYEQANENNKIFDYEELSKEYDGIYVNHYKINFSGKIQTFKDWSVNTLLLFNINCIDNYQSINIAPHNPYDSEDLPKIVSISDNKIINMPSETYLYLYEYVKNIFNESLVHYSNIVDYDKYLEMITEIIKKCKLLMITEKKNEIEYLFKILESEEVPIFNDSQKEIVIYNIILNYLSEYLKINKDLIKELPKSMIRQRKIYEF